MLVKLPFIIDCISWLSNENEMPSSRFTYDGLFLAGLMSSRKALSPKKVSPISAYLNSRTFEVSVPVLSEKMYSICPSSSFNELEKALEKRPS